ncbi:vWA domain-containing protein [Streptosporangium sp. H16]|uniref:vWA domain-containing protein n=1 Tax=Streptosporangium sp. H16 TaxID=3444184 RepID=UPI003F7A24C8
MKTHIAFILDESGSMYIVKKETESGLAAFLQEQRDVPSETTVSLYPFSNTLRVAYEYQPLDNVPAFELKPNGYTALLDAVGQSIRRMKEHFAQMPEGDRPDQVIVVILTDGEENVSREYSRERIKRRIARQTEVYGWKFVFLGADQDAFRAAGGMGIGRESTLSYGSDRTEESMTRAGMTVARGTRTGTFAFTDDDRKAAE